MLPSPGETRPKSRIAVCGGCGLLCDDISLPDADSFEVKVEAASNLCSLGKKWFRSDSNNGSFRVNGKTTDFETAISRAGELIKTSQMALMGGLEGLSTTAQQAAWRLADQNRMMIDSTWNYRGRGESLSVQQIGHVTATLGEIAERSDLSLYWFCNPASTHPRHLERFERTFRERIVIDSELSETGKLASQFVPLNRQQASIAINILHGLLADVKLDAERVQQVTGHGLKFWQQLLARILRSRYVAIYTNPGSHQPSTETDFDSEAEGLAKLVRRLNLKTRVVSLALRNDENGIGAENVLAWSSGFPFAINLNRGYPRFSGKEFSIESVLERRECDLIFLASTSNLKDNWSKWSDQAKSHFSATRKIVLAAEEHSIRDHLAVEIPVARCGVSCDGDFCRQDNISIGMPTCKPDQTRLTPERVLELLFAG